MKGVTIMTNNNITFILCILCFVFSLLTSLSELKQYLNNMIESLQDYRLITDFKYKKLDEKGGIDNYLKLMIDTIKVLYPKNTFTASVKLVSKSSTENPLESEVVTLASYPSTMYKIKPTYKIKNNTDLSTIVKDNKEYFFVSDLKRYSNLNKYKKEIRNSIDNYNTCIVFPISKDGDEIIGFLCINSPQKLNNVKKNRKLRDIVKVSASHSYDLLIDNKLRQEAISKKNINKMLEN